MWFAVGEGVNYSIAYSYDGIEWKGLENSKGSNFSVRGRCLTINPSTGLIVAGGEGIRTAAYSSDGFNWTYIQIYAGTQTMMDVIYHESTGRFYGAFVDSAGNLNSGSNVFSWTYNTGPQQQVTYHPEIDGGGWILVRRASASNNWHNATDDLQGTDSYGTYVDDDSYNGSFSIPFETACPNYNQFLFWTRSNNWLVMRKTEVQDTWGESTWGTEQHRRTILM